MSVQILIKKYGWNAGLGIHEKHKDSVRDHIKRMADNGRRIEAIGDAKPHEIKRGLKSCSVPYDLGPRERAEVNYILER